MARVQADALVRWGNPLGEFAALVEVKVMRPESALKNLSNRVRDFAGSVLLARDVLGPQTSGLLVLVLDDSYTATEMMVTDIEARATSLAPSRIEVECVPLSLLDQWTPRSPFTRSSGRP